MLSCAPTENTGALEQIVGGGVVQGAHFPGLVKMRWDGGGCSGTKINRNQILTAGHCLFDDASQRHRLNPGDKMEIVSHIADTGKYTVVDIWVHPNYKREHASWKDLAVITTQEDIVGIARADLAREKPVAKAKVTIAGYGCTQRAAMDRDLRVPSSAKFYDSGPKYGHLQLLDESGVKAIIDSKFVLYLSDKKSSAQTRISFSKLMQLANTPESAIRERRFFSAPGVGAGARSEICWGDSGSGLYLKGTNKVIGVAADHAFIQDSSFLALQLFASVPDAFEAIENEISTAKPLTKNGPSAKIAKPKMACSVYWCDYKGTNQNCGITENGKCGNSDCFISESRGCYTGN